MQNVEIEDLLENTDATEEQIVEKLRQTMHEGGNPYLDDSEIASSEIIVIEDDEYMQNRQRRATILAENEEEEADGDDDNDDEVSRVSNEHQTPLKSALQVGLKQKEEFKVEEYDRVRRLSSMDGEQLIKMFNINQTGFVKRKEMQAQIISEIFGLTSIPSVDSNPVFNVLYGEQLIRHLNQNIVCEHTFQL